MHVLYSILITKMHKTAINSQKTSARTCRSSCSCICWGRTRRGRRAARCAASSEPGSQRRLSSVGGYKQPYFWAPQAKGAIKSVLGAAWRVQSATEKKWPCMPIANGTDCRAQLSAVSSPGTLALSAFWLKWPFTLWYWNEFSTLHIVSCMWMLFLWQSGAPFEGRGYKHVLVLLIG